MNQDSVRQIFANGFGAKDSRVALLGACGLVVFLCLIPPIYLILRVSDDLSHAWEILISSSSISIMFSTLALVCVTTIIAMGIGLFCAWLTEYTNFPYPALFRVLFSLPLAIPTYVGAIVMISIFSPDSFLGRMAETLGISSLPSVYGFWGSTVVLALFTYPYVFLIVRQALAGIDRSLLESSRILGHGAINTFVNVVFPLLRNALFSGGLLVALYALSDFGSVSLLRFDSLTMLIFIEYDGAFDRNAASAISLLLMVFALLLVTALFNFRGRQTVGSLRTARSAYRVSLGYWLIPVTIISGLLLISAIGLPLLVLSNWLLRELDLWQAMLSTIKPLRDNLVVGLSAGVLTAAAAFPVALLAVRYGALRISRPIEVLSYSGYALPGIVVGLSLVSFGIHFGFFYQSLGLLLAAYIILFLPQALNIQKPALLNIHPHIQEAARSLGKNSVNVFKEMTLPLMGRGLLAASALVFLTTLKELPATVMLSPIGFESLALRVWTSANDGFFAEAALPSLLLIVFSALALFLVDRTNFGASGQ